MIDVCPRVTERRTGQELEASHPLGGGDPSPQSCDPDTALGEAAKKGVGGCPLGRPSHCCVVAYAAIAIVDSRCYSRNRGFVPPYAANRLQDSNGKERHV